MRSRCISRPERGAALALALGCGAALAAVEVPTLATTEPVAYGHRLGDVVERQLHLRLPPGARLETSSLPVPGTQGALELRALQHQGAADAAEQTLRLRYQVMRSSEQPAVIELPTLTLRVTLPAGATRREAVLRAEAWPLVVGPLTPPQPPERAGLGPLQPDRPLPVQPIAPIRQQAQLGAALALLAAAWLGWRHLGRPLWWRRQRPFARAWRALRHDASLDAQLRRLHRAIDEDAGRAVQAEDLAAWLADRPAYAPLADELRAVLDASASHFFAPATGRDDAALATRLRTLLRQLAQAEAHA